MAAVPVNMSPGFLEVFEQVGLIRRQQMKKRAMSPYVRIPAGHETAPGGAAYSVLGMTLVEAYAFRRKPVDVGCFYKRMSVTGNAFGPEFIGIEEYKIQLNLLIHDAHFGFT